MKQLGWIFVTAILLGVSSTAVAAAQAVSPDPKGKTCRMEQQCRWENFKKICVYVKVCR